MLDEFVEEQKIAITILKNAINQNQFSHAYLLETNGYIKVEEIAISFSKYLLCPNNYSNHDKCGSCNQCQLIDQKIFSEIKIIEPDGLWIKKEQLDILQKELMQTAIQSKYRVYIIKNAEKMNTSAANSILKFLEEPVPNLIAILITDNRYQLLDTIISRCQIISFLKQKKIGESMLEKIENTISIPSTLDKHNIEKYVKTVVKFIEIIENKHEITLLYTQNLWHEIIDTSDKMLFAFEAIILFYKDVLNIKIKNKLDFYDEFEDIIRQISNKNTIKKLISKMNISIQTKEKLKLNVNQNLLIDEFILEVGCDL